jgi:hypothetical protein
LTRFYIEDNNDPLPSFPAVYHIDDVQFLHDTNQENDQQVYSVTGTYSASNNRLVLTWMHDLGSQTINDEVRYSFTDIHASGWASATAAPNGVIAPLNSGGYNGMDYDTTALPLSGHSVVYIAIKPQNSSVFTEIAVPLNQWVQTSVADFSAGTQNGTAVTTSSSGSAVQLAAGALPGTFQSSGTFTSSVFDAASTVTWGTANWTATLPAGTSLTVMVRTGNTATPDSSWSAWTSVTNQGSISSLSGRYFQYEVIMGTSNLTQTPTLSDIWFSWN